MVTYQNLASNIWETFYDRIKDQVTSVTLSDSTSRTVQTWTASFPDKEFDNKDAYPIIVIETPTISWADSPTLTMTKKKALINITIEAYDSKSESAEMFLDAMNYAIETYRKDLKDLGLDFVKQELTDSDEVFRGKIKVHVRRTMWSMEYNFTSTRV